jgi:hypothetical protein
MTKNEKNLANALTLSVNLLLKMEPHENSEVGVTLKNIQKALSNDDSEIITETYTDAINKIVYIKNNIWLYFNP